MCCSLLQIFTFNVLSFNQTFSSLSKYTGGAHEIVISYGVKLPPPPSKNPSFLEYIIDMETKGATFFMDGKKITANEAKAIAKNNKGKGTEMITQKDENGKYVVKLSKQIKD